MTKRSIVDIEKSRVYSSILVDEKDICTSDLWFYNIAKKIGFDFDNPTGHRNYGAGLRGYFYRLKDTPIYIAARYCELFVDEYNSPIQKVFKLSQWRGTMKVDENMCISVEEKLFIDLVNELLASVGYEQIDCSKEYLPDNVDRLIDIVNGKD